MKKLFILFAILCLTAPALANDKLAQRYVDLVQWEQWLKVELQKTVVAKAKVKATIIKLSEKPDEKTPDSTMPAPAGDR